MSFADHTQKTKPRLLTVTESCRYYPRITISGVWLRDWGFAIGDRVFLLRIANGEILIRVRTKLEETDVAKYCRQTGPLSNFAIRDSPSYHLAASQRNYPEIVITGAWLRYWGFTTGDRISLTMPEKDHVLMKVIIPATEWRQVLQKKSLMHAAAIANANLERHKAANPSLYADFPIFPKKRTVPPRATTSASPSFLNEILASTNNHSPADAARSANTPAPVS